MQKSKMAVWEGLTNSCEKKRSERQRRRGKINPLNISVQLLSRVRLCDPMNCSTPGLPVHHQLSEFTQSHVHRVGDAIQPSHPLLSPSPLAFNLSQHHGLFKWVSSSHQVGKVLEFQLQHQSFQWTPKTDLHWMFGTPENSCIGLLVITSIPAAYQQMLFLAQATCLQCVSWNSVLYHLYS